MQEEEITSFTLAVGGQGSESSLLKESALFFIPTLPVSPRVCSKIPSAYAREWQRLLSTCLGTLWAWLLPPDPEIRVFPCKMMQQGRKPRCQQLRHHGPGKPWVGNSESSVGERISRFPSCCDLLGNSGLFYKRVFSPLFFLWIDAHSQFRNPVFLNWLDVHMKCELG